MAISRGAPSSNRTLLGPADVSDESLSGMVARSLGVSRAEVLDCEVTVAEYDLVALTTAGRYWVRGTARHDGGTSSYAFFVKVVQTWARTPAFAYVPEHVREIAAAGLPWRTEPQVYRSDLRDRLPAGFSMPQAYAVVDLDEGSAAVWLAGVDVDDTPWDAATFERAARGLGRFAASAAVSPVREVGSHDVVQGYVHGRIQHQVAPALRDAGLWDHPVVAAAFDADDRARLLAALDALPRYVEELARAPLGSAHGDACPRNLLRVPGAPDDFVLIDFSFFCEAPLGFDLSQLLLGEVQVGERPASELADLDDRCLRAYVEGLRDEGCQVPFEVVRRAHALVMLLFCGLSAVPVEVLAGGPAPGGTEVVRQRAEAARFVLDLVDSTSPPAAADARDDEPAGARTLARSHRARWGQDRSRVRPAGGPAAPAVAAGLAAGPVRTITLPDGEDSARRCARGVSWRGWTESTGTRSRPTSTRRASRARSADRPAVMTEA
jgi:hypothetical protein